MSSVEEQRFHARAQFDMAAKIIGLPKYDDVIKEARMFMKALHDEGFTATDIGRALGFKDFPKSKKDKTIQNHFRVKLNNIGFSDLVERAGLASVIGKGFPPRLREVRAKVCRERLKKMQENGKTRNEAVYALSHSYQNTDIARALGISSERVRQLVERVREASGLEVSNE